MKFQTLQDLFVDTLKDLYNAEGQIVKALPKMEQAAHSSDLKQGFQMHLDQTHHQVERLTQIFQDLNLRPEGKTCKGMEGIIAEGQELMRDAGDPDVLDAGLIEAAQKVEHYEISSYGTARTFAHRLGYTNAAQLLQQTLDEEKQTDEKLTVLAERSINQQAKTSK
jgi:ferritin-like metal-binding protein YciE